MKDRRLRMGLTQAAVEKRCGIPQSRISKFETGKGRFSLEEFRRYCRALNCEAGMVSAMVRVLEG